MTTNVLVTVTYKINKSKADEYILLAHQFLGIVNNSETNDMISQFENVDIDMNFTVAVQALLFRLCEEAGELQRAKHSASTALSLGEQSFPRSERASMLVMNSFKRFMDIAEPAFRTGSL